MRYGLGRALPALALAVGVIGVVTDADATAWTMVPAATGLPAYSGKTYYVESGGGVFTLDSGGMGWVVPVPNYTGQSNGGSAYIDLGACDFAWGQGVAVDDHGNMEASTGTVYASHTVPTSQSVSFGSGFSKTGYTYVGYYLSLDYDCVANGIEYAQY